MNIKKLIPTKWHYPLSQIKRTVLGYNKYSQYGEDEVLLELFKDTPSGVYVDVGAHHPYRYSNTYLLYKKGWHGINIDPNEKAIALFAKARPKDTNICCGVGTKGELTYYRFSDPAVNTFIAEEAEKSKRKSFITYLGESRVPVHPLSELITGPFDLLSIDAEGMDLEILQSYDWKFYPKVIVVEGDKSESFLKTHGYFFYATRGLSKIYTRP